MNGIPSHSSVKAVESYIFAKKPSILVQTWVTHTFYSMALSVVSLKQMLTVLAKSFVPYRQLSLVPIYPSMGENKEMMMRSSVTKYVLA